MKIRGIILAAGRGSRMRGLTASRPKCLVNVHGKPLIEWQIEAMRSSGIDEISIVTGYKKKLLEKYNLRQFYNALWNKTNMVTSLSCAKEWLKTSPCVVSYSDIFYLSGAIKLLLKSTSELSITYDPNWIDLWKKRFRNPLLDAETFRLNDDSTLSEIGSKTKNIEDIEGQYMGLLKFTPYSWVIFEKKYSELSEDDRYSLDLTTALSNLIKSHECNIRAIPYYGLWGEVDTERDLNIYNSNLDLMKS